MMRSIPSSWKRSICSIKSRRSDRLQDFKTSRWMMTMTIRMKKRKKEMRNSRNSNKNQCCKSKINKSSSRLCRNSGVNPQ